MGFAPEADLYASLREHGGTHRMIDRMQTRQELHDTIGLHQFGELDASIVRIVVPQTTG